MAQCRRPAHARGIVRSLSVGLTVVGLSACVGAGGGGGFVGVAGSGGDSGAVGVTADGGGGQSETVGGGSDGPQTVSDTQGGGADTIGAICGDGQCQAGESQATCPQDCKAGAPFCGDLACNGGETPATCPGDCPLQGGTWKKCVFSKCQSQWSACSASAACVGAANCIDACNGVKQCEQACFEATPDDGKNPLMNLYLCGGEQQCGGANPVSCGDGTCGAGENSTTCPQDCKQGAVCGDGACNGAETAMSCPADCKTAAKCGNGVCEAGESQGTCPADCQPVAQCGNGVCESAETSNNCPQDCGLPNKCGNGVCDAGETQSSCPADCKSSSKCGNGICDAGESSTSCPKDCKPANKCGNGVCDADESSSTCPVDCPADDCFAQKCAKEIAVCDANPKCVATYLYAALSGCSKTNGCQDGPCVQTFCGTEFQECTGTPACNTLLGCLQGCKQDQACATKCFGTGIDDYEAMATCYDNWCGP